jgi:iron(III) transport system ATP-binding protein
MLSAENVTFGFDGKNLIFKDLSLHVAPGQIISIVGPSGAGKTTLLKCLAGQKQLQKGQIRIDDDTLFGPEEQLLSGHEDLAIVDQGFSLDFYFTVYENIANRLLHLTEDDRTSFIEELLVVFGLTELREHRSKYISGGEKQRLSMACALAKEPKYLLLDEPFSNLDVHLKKSIGSYLRELQEIRNMGVVLVTHEGSDALAWSDSIYFLKNSGKLRKYTPYSAYHAPKSLYEGRFFGQLNSIYEEGKQILFRPTEYELAHDSSKKRIQLTFMQSDFHGHYRANYFKLVNGKEIVLYADDTLQNVTEIYV